MGELERAKELSLPMDASFRWSVGECMEEFYQGLGKRKLLASVCPSCGKVYVPPRTICERCYAETSEWREVGDGGTVEAFTVAHVEVDPKEGGLRDLEGSEIIALIRPDGADSAFAYRVDEAAPEDMRTGMRVEAVWAAEPEGALSDLLYFRPAG